jgi:2-(1,2-epoxy-1,2-dihydrophenyl)acetyl-CoA isomerase
MAYEFLAIEKVNRVAKVIMTNPAALNAMNKQMEREMIAGLKQLESDDAIRVVVVTGEGRSFCSGADWKWLDSDESYSHASPDEMRQALIERQELILVLHHYSKPLIAMVNGPAVTIGVDIACYCDMRIGCETTRFLHGWTRMGLAPGGGAPWHLPRIVGLGKAAEILLTMGVVEAEEAYRIGLLNRLVDSDDLESETMQLAQEVADGPPVALRLIRTMLYEGLDSDLESALALAALCEPITLSSDDHQEALAAFREKRKPSFEGR